MSSHKDQADTLRRLMSLRPRGEADAREDRERKRMPRVVTFSSGKGGVGKSCLAANLAALNARAGLRTLLVDGDFGLASLDIMLGVQAGATFEQVLDGCARPQDAVVGVERNLWLLPASSGLLALQSASLDTRERLANLFSNLPWDIDLVFVDVGAGIQSNVLAMHSPLFASAIVVTPEPTSITDAYGLIKLLRKHALVTRAGVVVNRVTDAAQARTVFKKLKEVADRFLDVELDLLGHCLQDENFGHSVMNRRILLDWNEGSRAVPALQLLAKRMRATGPDTDFQTAIEFQDETDTAGFFRTLLGGVKEA